MLFNNFNFIVTTIEVCIIYYIIFNNYINLFEITLTGSLIPELPTPKDFPGVQPIFSNSLKPLFFVGIGLKYIKVNII